MHFTNIISDIKHIISITKYQGQNRENSHNLIKICDCLTFKSISSFLMAIIFPHIFLYLDYTLIIIRHYSVRQHTVCKRNFKRECNKIIKIYFATLPSQGNLMLNFIEVLI